MTRRRYIELTASAAILDHVDYEFVGVYNVLKWSVDGGASKEAINAIAIRPPRRGFKFS